VCNSTVPVPNCLYHVILPVGIPILFQLDSDWDARLHFDVLIHICGKYDVEVMADVPEHWYICNLSFAPMAQGWGMEVAKALSCDSGHLIDLKCHDGIVPFYEKVVCNMHGVYEWNQLVQHDATPFPCNIMVY